ncbi:MAG: DUF3667 domain-containing protein, partial [Litorimonas sp.]
YCAACGQRVVRDADFSLWRLSRDWVAAMFSLDSRGLTTLRRLLFQPGRLSSDYIAGRRAAAFSPFQIFVFVTLAFFLLPDNYDIFKAPARWFFPGQAELVQVKMAELELSEEALSVLYDSTVGTVSKLGLVVIIGALSLASWLAGIRRMREFGKHLVVAVHDFCAMLLMFLVVLLPFAFLLDAVWPAERNRGMMEAGSLLVVLVYLTLSQRRVLGIGWVRAGLHALPIFVVLATSIMIYRGTISWLTLWSL